MKGFAAVIEPMFAGRGIDRHSADGIAYAHIAVSIRMMVAMAGVLMISVVATESF